MLVFLGLGGSGCLYVLRHLPQLLHADGVLEELLEVLLLLLLNLVERVLLDLLDDVDGAGVTGWGED